MTNENSNGTNSQAPNMNLLAAHVSIDAPHYKNSRFYNFPNSFARLYETKVGHAGHHLKHLSALSPAAYFVDLVRLLEDQFGWTPVASLKEGSLIKALELSPDLGTLFVGGSGGVYGCSLADMPPAQERQLKQIDYNAVWWHGLVALDDQTLVSKGQVLNIAVEPPQTLAEAYDRYSTIDDGAHIYSLLLSQDGQKVFGWGKSGQFYLYEVASNKWDNIEVSNQYDEFIPSDQALTPDGKRLIVAGRYIGDDNSYGGVRYYEISDNSKNKIKLQADHPLKELGSIQAIMVMSDEQTVLVGTHQGLFHWKLADNVVKPLPANQGLDEDLEKDVSAIRLAPDGATLYVGTKGGVFTCQFAGGSFTPWLPFNTGLEDDKQKEVTVLVLTPDGRTLYAATAGGQIFRRQIDSNELKHRRPDLWHLPLDREHTEELVPFLEIVNNVLRTHLSADGKGVTDDKIRYRRKQAARKKVAAARHPFNLPLNMPLLEIRTYLAHFGVKLESIYETFQLSKEGDAWAAEVLGLAPGELKSLATPNTANLADSYGLAEITGDTFGGLDEVPTFLKQTGLAPDELGQLLQITLPDAASKPELGFKAPDAEANEETGPTQVLLGLNEAILDYWNRFIRLSRRLGYSFSDLALALRASKTDLAAEGDSLGKLSALAQIKWLSEKFNQPLEVLCSFVADMDTSPGFYAPDKASTKSFFDRVFNSPPFYQTGDTPPTAYHPQGPGDPDSPTNAMTWDSKGQEIKSGEMVDIRQTATAEKKNQGIRSSLQAALKVGSDDLQAIADHLYSNEEILLDVPGLTRMYRISKMAGILGLKVPAYLLLLKCLTGEGPQRLEAPEVTSLKDLQTVDYWAGWLQEAGLTPYQLEYLATGQVSGEGQRQTDPIYTHLDSARLINEIEQKLGPALLKPRTLNRDLVQQMQLTTQHLAEYFGQDAGIVAVSLNYLAPGQRGVTQILNDQGLRDLALLLYLARTFDLSKAALEHLLHDLAILQTPSGPIKELSGFVAGEPDAQFMKPALLNFQSFDDSSDLILEKHALNKWRITVLDWQQPAIWQGATALVVGSGAGAVFDVALAADAGQIFAATEAGLWRSANNGGTWQRINVDLEDEIVTSIAVTPDGLTLFAGTESGHVYYGTTKKDSRTSFKWQQVGREYLALDRIDHLAVSANGQFLFGAQDYVLFRATTAEGIDWTLADWDEPSDEFPWGAVLSLATSADGQYLFVGTDDEVIYSEDSGDSWKTAAPELSTVKALTVSSDGQDLLIASDDYLGRFVKNGEGWELRWDNEQSDINALALSKDGRTLFAVRGQPGTLHRYQVAETIFDVRQKGQDDYRLSWGLNKDIKFTLDNLQAIESLGELGGTFTRPDAREAQIAQELAAYAGQPSSSSLAVLSGWAADQITPLQDFLTLKIKQNSASMDPPGIITRLRLMKRCFDQAQKLGVNIQMLIQLCQIHDERTAFNDISAAAQALLGVIRSKYTPNEWQTIFSPLRDQLNEIERDALAALLLHDKGFDSLQELSDFLLIDVEMSGCAEMSYLKEAIGCLQIYIERCRLQLEEGVSLAHDAIPESLWAWMGHYRIWEANRKVFFYPENYLEPGQRRGATPQFKELNSELLQGEITAGAVDSAYNNYFDKIEALSRLTIVSSYYATIDIPAEDRQENRLYLFGRSNTSPPVYYHRSAVVANDTISSWQPWQRIDLSINADTLSAIHALGTLFVFWVEQKEETQTVAVEDKNTHVRVTKATVMYSFQNISGNWVHPQTMSSLQDLQIGVDIQPIIDLLKNELQDKATKYFKKAQEKTKGTVLTIGSDLSSDYDYDIPPSTIDIMDIFADWTKFYAYALQSDSQKRKDWLWDKIIDMGWDCVIRDGIKKNTEGASLDWKTRRPFDLMEQAKRNLADAVKNLNENAAELKEQIRKQTPIMDQFSPWQNPQVKDWSYTSVYVAAYENFILVRYGGQSVIQTSVPATPKLAWTSYLNDDLHDEELNQSLMESLGHPTNKDLLRPTADSISVGGRPKWSVVNSDDEQFLQLSDSERIPLGSTTINKLSRRMFAGGVDHLLDLEAQQIQEKKRTRVKKANVYVDLPPKPLDFDGPFGIYFWEIFFHIPFLIADALNGNQQFETARDWYHYILDPTRRQDNSQALEDEAGMWRFLPFRGHTLEQLQADLNNPANQDELVKDAFNPDGIAQTRPGAYEKAVAMKYIDNLLDWGDMLFAQDNWEAINQAALLYVRALNLLGPKPQPQFVAIPTPQTSQTVNGVIKSEDWHAPSPDLAQIIATAGDDFKNEFFDVPTYFELPENDSFAGYWDRAQERLYKIRHCMNISGVVRQLALFQPPVDPRMLIRALAAGLDLSSAAAQLSPAVPHYRFATMIGRAKSLTATVIQLGASLLSALEKKDAEAINLLRSTQEQLILNMTRSIKEAQIKEGMEHLAALEKSLNAATYRHTHYSDLKKAGYSFAEAEVIALDADALLLQTTVAIMRLAAIPGYATEVIAGTSNGQVGEGSAIMAEAQAVESAGAALQHAAGMTATIAQFERRKQDWDLQQALAGYDVEQITSEIEGAKARQEILERDLEIHEKSMQQAQERVEFFRRKFSSQELYQWMAGRLSTIYFQTYKLAFDLALTAERAYQYERHTDQKFINFGLWDNLRKGLLAGDGLMLALNQLEKAHLDGDARELEIEKTISLRQLDPAQLLVLKTTGKCAFELKEQLFDYDFPGHYCRRIKSLSISIPAVVGPYQNIQATLTQKGDRVLIEADETAVGALLTGEGLENVKPGALRSNWRPFQQIAISKGIDDSGMFQLDFRDERYLPFEGTGAISHWELSLPKAANRSLDFNTVSDVIINLRYTALDGGQPLREFVTKNEKISTYSGLRVFSLAQENASEWPRFVAQQALPVEADQAENGSGKANNSALHTPPLSFSLPPERLALNCQIKPLPAESEIHFQAIWAEGKGSAVNLTLTINDSEPVPDKNIQLNDQGAGSIVLEQDLNLPGEWKIETEKLTELSGLLDILLIVPFEGDLIWN